MLREDAPYLFDGLKSRGAPLVALSAICGAAALVLLIRGAVRGARVLAVVAVASVVFSWGAAQWPYLLPKSLTVSEAAAPTGTLIALLVAVALAAVTVLPGFALLYVLDQKGLLPEEAAAAAGERDLHRRAEGGPRQS